VARQVEARLRELLDGEGDAWTQERSELAPLFAALRRFVLAGGKRLRPAFCFWGAVGAGADPDDPVLGDAGAALELVHSFALIHDDVMDGSATRRGRPSMQRQFEGEHDARGLAGESRRYGEGLAVLAGDLAFVYADVLTDRLPRPARALWHRLRIELTMGQWVDVTAAAGRDRSPARARWIASYKSGRYTVERPLHLGAGVAGRLDLLEAYSAFGRPLGEAFQLRDDLLGVFGDADVTGKPAGEDLREGKPTLLLATGLERARGCDRRLLGRAGEPGLGAGEIAAMRAVLDGCGARQAMEHEIDRLAAMAMDALGPLPIAAEAKAMLRALGARALWRRQ
jgi:geranylgeranyl diphosphate synthase type I